jgi:hypothetical protein
VIKQNNVFLRFPVKNNFKIKALGNKLNIKPKEEVVLIVLAPKKEYERNENLDVNHPYIEIEGYLDKLSGINQFSKWDSILDKSCILSEAIDSVRLYRQLFSKLTETRVK